jgi:hypothetical protein
MVRFSFFFALRFVAVLFCFSGVLLSPVVKTCSTSVA